MNNFWKTCPLKHSKYPDSTCENRDCPWAINSKKYNNCFWKMLRDLSDERGELNPLSSGEIANLLNLDSSSLNKLSEEVFSFLKKSKDFRELQTLFHQ